MTDALPAFRCSTAARARGDALAGTASTVRAFLLLEEPGPWGADALRDARLWPGFGADLARACEAAGVRPLLIRQSGRPHGRRRRLFAAHVSAAGGWIEAGKVEDPRDVLDLDLRALRRGDSVGLPTWTDPLYAVCTQGRHDACCAERGRPVARALRAVEPEAAWEVSHIGGDRFAANLLALPTGVYYGGLDAASVATVVAADRAGRVDLDHLRGRTCWPMPVQAAEVALRRHLDLARIDDGIRLASWGPTAGGAEAVFARGDRRWRVEVARHESEPVQLTCSGLRRQPSVTWRPGAISPAE